MAAGETLTRHLIDQMSLAEYARREVEIMRWLREGAVDGQAATPMVRPVGHVFSRSEIAGMGSAEFAANEAAIDAQVAAKGIDQSAEK
jgi:hypothetical protein